MAKKKEGTLSNLCYGTSITLIPKLDKDTQENKTADQYPLLI